MSNINYEAIAERMLKGSSDVVAPEATPEQNKSAGTYPAQPNQIKYVKDLCEQKHVAFTEDMIADGKTASATIGKLLKIKSHVPASEKQIERIKELCEFLGTPLPDFDKLVGGMGGTASLMIQKLTEMKKNRPEPATEKQIEAIIQMQLCPDCDSVDFSEFTKQEASDYIGKFQNDYRVWIKSRLAPEQIDRIRQLCELMETPFSYASIIQLDVDSASRYIDQLEYEFKSKPWAESSLEPEEMRGIKSKEDSDEHEKARAELRSLVARLYASIGQELEEEFFETMDWAGLTELCNFVKMFGIDISGMIEDINIFNAAQKDVLLSC